MILNIFCLLVTDVSEFLVKQMSGLFHPHDIELWQVISNQFLMLLELNC